MESFGKTGKKIILSTGMGTLEEIREAIKTLKKSGAKEIIILHCTSNYPTLPDNTNILALSSLKKSFDFKIGFSDHTIGNYAAVMAVALGATVIEKHITIDKKEILKRIKKRRQIEGRQDDDINILKATFLGMKKSLGNLDIKPDKVLIDGPYSNITIYPTDYIVNGDNISQSIAAASIIAKVTRDNIMKDYDKIFPEYKFINHKGYGTKYHIEQFEINKSTPIHRRSFKIVKNNMPTYEFYLNKENGFKNLAHQLVGVKYIKNNFIVNDQNIEFNNIVTNYCLVDKKNNYKFVKVLDNETKDLKKKDIDNSLDSYISENNIKNNYTIDVISVKFIKGKKPIIKVI